MRVLYSFPHAIGRPGIGTTAAAQVQGSLDRGIEVTLCCASLEYEFQGIQGIAETMVFGRTRIPHRTIGVDRAYHYHDWRVGRVLSSAPGQFDLVHCWPLASLQTLKAAKLAGVGSLREVPNSHTEAAYLQAELESELIGVKLPRNHSHLPNSRRLQRERIEYELADTLLVPSDHVRQTFLDRGFPIEKLARHRYGFDVDRFPAPEVAAPKPFDEPLVALFVGNGEPRKGLHYALRAWMESGIADCGGRFLICGPILRAYKRFLEPLLAHPSIELLGFVANVGRLMREADVLLVPSIEEGSALVTYEAQASGCVLLVSEASGAICRHLDEGLVHKAGDVEALATHLRLINEDRALLARLRAAAIARRLDLSWGAAADALVEIYADCLRLRRVL